MGFEFKSELTELAFYTKYGKKMPKIAVKNVKLVYKKFLGQNISKVVLSKEVGFRVSILKDASLNNSVSGPNTGSNKGGMD
jgi:hypothetical protein